MWFVRVFGFVICCVVAEEKGARRAKGERRRIGKVNDATDRHGNKNKARNVTSKLLGRH